MMQDKNTQHYSKQTNFFLFTFLNQGHEKKIFSRFVELLENSKQKRNILEANYEKDKP